MNKLPRNLLIAASLALTAPSAFAWTLHGDMTIASNDVMAFTVGTTGNSEDISGLYVVVTIPGEDTSDNNCVDDSIVAGIQCVAEAQVPSPIPGSGYCASGSGWSTVLRVPNPGDGQAWGVTCRGYQPPRTATASGPSFTFCNEACARWRYTYSASRAATYRIQSRPASGGTWSTYTVTGNTSTLLHLGQNARQWRVRGENSHGVGPWSGTSFTSSKCGSSGGPGGGGVLD